MLNKNLLCVVGGAGSGKDSVADYLVKNHGFSNIKFSTPVKSLVRKILGREIDKSKDRELIIDVSFLLKGNVPIGEFTKKHGTYNFYKIMRWCAELEYEYSAPCTPFTEEFWADYTLESILYYDENGTIQPLGPSVFTDVRLPSEYQALKKLGAVYVWLDCPQEVRENRLRERDGGFMSGIWDSPFEKHMLGWEYDIILDATKPFDEVIKDLMEKYNTL